MGLTICWEFESRSDDPGEKLKRLREAAVEAGMENVSEVCWRIGPQCLDIDLGVPFEYDQIAIEGVSMHWSLAQDNYRPVVPELIAGFTAVPGPGCSPASFLLCRYPYYPLWRHRGFCKTQYAANPSYGGVDNFVNCHLKVTKVLDKAAEIGILKSVADEGGYWETRDVEELKRALREWDLYIAAIVGGLASDAREIGLEAKARITERPDFERLEAQGCDWLRRRLQCENPDTPWPAE